MKTETLRIGLAGGTGQMSKRIYQVASHDPGVQVTILVSRDLSKLYAQEINPSLDHMHPLCTDVLNRETPHCDVMIDFTHPDMIHRYADYLCHHQIPLLIGTSGLQEYPHLSTIQHLSQRIPVLYSSNISIGMNVFFYIVKKVAAHLSPEYHAEVLDIHHRAKKDAPSATASRLATMIATERESNFGVETAISQQVGQPRIQHEVGIQSLRMGYGVGEHTVYFAGDGERVELTHRVFNREPIAKLALDAASWLIQQKPGLYSMADMLGLNE